MKLSCCRPLTMLRADTSPASSPSQGWRVEPGETRFKRTNVQDLHGSDGEEDHDEAERAVAYLSSTYHTVVYAEKGSETKLVRVPNAYQNAIEETITMWSRMTSTSSKFWCYLTTECKAKKWDACTKKVLRINQHNMSKAHINSVISGGLSVTLLGQEADDDLGSAKWVLNPFETRRYQELRNKHVNSLSRPNTGKPPLSWMLL